MYKPSNSRYDSMPYNRLGNSGLKLPAVSLGLWHNFGTTGQYETILSFRSFIHSLPLFYALL
mgnify:CR=1 FL=1